MMKINIVQILVKFTDSEGFTIVTGYSRIRDLEQVRVSNIPNSYDANNLLLQLFLHSLYVFSCGVFLILQLRVSKGRQHFVHMN